MLVLSLFLAGGFFFWWYLFCLWVGLFVLLLRRVGVGVVFVVVRVGMFV